MIRLTRTVRPPSSLAGEKRIEKNLALIELERAGKKPQRHVWKPAKEYLKEESHGKCAYCESATSTVAHGDVEHFRPQSVYWWLAYCYDNFSYSCQLCNQTYKNDVFRVARGDRRWRAPEFPPRTDLPALREYARSMTPDLPWITIPNLGSHIFSLVCRQLPQDWTERYSTTPALIETPRFTGALYKASG